MSGVPQTIYQLFTDWTTECTDNWQETSELNWQRALFQQFNLKVKNFKRLLRLYIGLQLQLVVLIIALLILLEGIGRNFWRIFVVSYRKTVQNSARHINNKIIASSEINWWIFVHNYYKNSSFNGLLAI